VATSRIDGMMRRFGMPMGPLRLCDEIGIDVVHHVATDLERRLAHPVPVDVTLGRMMADGRLGRKTGAGSYDHDGPARKDASEAGPEDALLQDRLVLLMVDEAARVLGEGGVESAEDVDCGMITGTGWAPFRSGPLRYAEARGVREIVLRLEELTRTVGP